VHQGHKVSNPIANKSLPEDAVELNVFVEQGDREGTRQCENCFKMKACGITHTGVHLLK
jgi:hypothetical protein